MHQTLSVICYWITLSFSVEKALRLQTHSHNAELYIFRSWVTILPGFYSNRRNPNKVLLSLEPPSVSFTGMFSGTVGTSMGTAGTCVETARVPIVNISAVMFIGLLGIPVVGKWNTCMGSSSSTNSPGICTGLAGVVEDPVAEGLLHYQQLSERSGGGIILTNLESVGSCGSN